MRDADGFGAVRLAATADQVETRARLDRCLLRLWDTDGCGAVRLAATAEQVDPCEGDRDDSGRNNV